MINSQDRKTTESLDPCRIGIDFGGTKIEIIVLSPADETIFRERVQTPTRFNDNYGETIKKIKTLFNKALNVLPERAEFTIGVGIPGTLDKSSGIVQNANTTWLANRHFCRDLEKTLGCKVFMENDANCFTLAEASGGAAKGYPMVFGIIMGTGCGGGLCINGTIHSGRHGIAGEWGHFAFDPQGEKCFCQNIGCIDTKLTGPGLSKSYKKLFSKTLTAEQIVDKARAKDPKCLKVFDHFLEDFGRAVGGLISILDPDAVVLGGGLSNISELYTDGIEKIQKYAFHKNIQTPILKNKLGDSAGVFGAAWLPFHIKV